MVSDRLQYHDNSEELYGNIMIQVNTHVAIDHDIKDEYVNILMPVRNMALSHIPGAICRDNPKSVYATSFLKL